MQQTGDISERKAFRPAVPGAKLAAHPFYDTFWSPENFGPFAVFEWGTPGRASKRFHLDGTSVDEMPMDGIASLCKDDLIPDSLPGSAYDGYDIMHMVPAKDMAFDRSAMADTWNTTNVWPMKKALSQGLWAELEAAVRERRRYGKIGIITGGIFSKPPRNHLPSGVAIPDAFFKVIFDPTAKTVASYVVPNEDNVKGQLNSYRVKLGEVEKACSDVKFPRIAGYEDTLELLNPSPREMGIKIEQLASIKIEQPASIKIENLFNGEYVLLEDFLYNPRDPNFPKARIRIKQGFTTDFGSTGLARGIYPPIGTFRDPYFLGHDAYYAAQYPQWEKAYKQIADSDAARAESDWLLLEGLQAAGDAWLNRNAIWSAVRLFGGFVWKAHTQKSISVARSLLETNCL